LAVAVHDTLDLIQEQQAMVMTRGVVKSKKSVILEKDRVKIREDIKLQLMRK
jgi:hypothetical protein